MPRLRSATQETSTGIQARLSAIALLFEFAEGGLPFLSMHRHLAYERSMLLLTEEVRRLLPPMGSAQAGALVDDVIGDLVKPAGIDATYLLAELGRRLSPEGDRELRVIAFLNAPPDQSPDSLTAANTAFDKLASLQVNEILLNEPFMEKAKHHNRLAAENLDRFAAYAYTVRVPEYLAAQGLEYVGDRITEPFERLRSLLNFAYHRRSVTVRFGMRREPLARYALSPFHLLESEDKVEEDFFWEAMPPDYEFHPIDAATAEALDRVEGLVYGQSSGRLAQHVGDLLLIYQKALDTPDPEAAFLHFWQVLEGMASPTQEKRGIESDKVVQRLNALAPFERNEEDILKRIGALRHELVHRSAFPGENAERYVRIIKLEADKFLLALLSLLPQLPEVVDLTEYYNVASDRSEARLRALQKAIRLAQAQDDR